MRAGEVIEPLLVVEGLSIAFGGIPALDGVSFTVERGSITGLIGPNGAGKTTCFNCITRLYRPASGRIAFAGEDLLHVPAHALARRGIVRTFQNVALFGGMTARENVLIGCDDRGQRAARAAADDVLAYLNLGAVAQRSVRGLPFGTRKTVELARALVARPRLLLLDEPASGLNHEEVAAFGETIARVRVDFDTTILMVEHHMGLVMGTSEYVVVLDSGRKLADGAPHAVARDPAVIEAYLGAA